MSILSYSTAAVLTRGSHGSDWQKTINTQKEDLSMKRPNCESGWEAYRRERERLESLTFSGVEDGSRLATAGLPVDTVGQRTHKVLLHALHDDLTHLVELLSVVDTAVELSVGI